ncbi:MAG: hypothetical protein QGG64_12200, partial [Candidatus Latescibacteria bacterium]|nr:hypothetical protein [Candidatus Latescibacterota bacterium]
MKPLAVVGLFMVCLISGSAHAGLGLYSLAAKVGLDVVQANDTRHFYVFQADVATVFSKNLRLEVGAE